MASRCPFCGKVGAKITREHVIGRKFVQDFPPPPASLQPERLVQRDLRRGVLREVDELDLVVRGPCAECNSGWMNQLDENVRPILKPMIWGKPAVLAPHEQSAVSRWAVKVAMVADFTHRGQRAMRPRDLESFYASREPTQHTGVWLAKHRERDPIVNLLARRMRYRPPGSRISDLLLGHLVTVRLGHLVVQVAVPWVRVPFPRGSDNERFVTRIWPIHNELRSWPPDQILSDHAELQEFSRAFRHGDAVAFLD